MEQDAGTVSMLLDSDENATKSVCIRMPMYNCQCISILLVSVGALFILKSIKIVMVLRLSATLIPEP